MPKVKRTVPKPGSEVTTWGLRILNNMPEKKGSELGIRTLIERCNGLGDYACWEGMVKQLIRGGYLKRRPHNYVVLTKKGREEIE